MARGWLIGCAIVAVLMGVAANAIAAPADGIQVDGAYALADAKSPQLGYVYFTVSAAQDDADVLLGGHSPLAEAVSLFIPNRLAAKLKSGDAQSLPVDGHVPLVLQPRGPHLILKGLMHPLHPGQKIPVTLTFQHAAPVDIVVEVMVRTPAAGAPRLPHGVKID